MQVSTKRSAKNWHDAVECFGERSRQHSIARITQKEDAFCQPGGGCGQANAIRRTAHDAIENDDGGRRYGVRIFEHVCHAKRALVGETLFLRQLSSIGRIGWNQFDDLAGLCALGQQFALNRSDTAANFENSRAADFPRRDTVHHPALESSQTLPPITLEIPARGRCRKYLLTLARPAATHHARYQRKINASSSTSAISTAASLALVTWNLYS